MATLDFPAHHRHHSCERPLIGITGKAGSGKDTVGDAIQADFGVQVNRHSFAEPLKEMLAELLQVPFEMLDGKTEKSREWREKPLRKLGKSPRELLLTLGTEWGRDMVHEDLWVIMAGQRFDRLETGAYFTDVRFPNEAEWIKARGGVVIELRKLDAADFSTAAVGHASEAGVPHYCVDAVVSARHGDLLDLQAKALQAVRDLGCRPSY